jgi:hypothetical protein
VVKLVAPSSDKIKPGDKLSLSFVEERLHFFDETTSKRI